MSVRGAERRDARANLSSLRPTTPMRHRAGAHAHHCPSVAWTKYAFEGRRTQPRNRTRRASPSRKSSPS